MRKTKSTLRIAIIFVVALALVGLSTSCSTSTTNKGLVIGAEQEPDCLDFLDACSASAWGFWMVAVNTLPHAYETTPVIENGERTGEWDYTVTNLLASEPVLTLEPKQSVTYQINPDAQWSDGKPITGADFVYTADQIKNGKEIYDKTGYDTLESVTVDPEDDLKVTATWEEPYAGWQQLFGGNYGVLPSHLLKGKDRNAEMKDGYTFSGGPWIAKWNKGKDIVLTPNDNYWGTKPSIEKVTFTFIEDSTSLLKSFQDNEVAVIYPQPQIDVVEAIDKGLDGADKDVNANSGNVELLWLNNEGAPFDNVAVRQALAYSLDRKQIVTTLFGGLGLTEPLNSFVPNILSEYQNEDAFASYGLDTAKAEKLLSGAGYKKNAQGKYAKNGNVLSFEIVTTEGNERRQLTMETIQKQLNDLGWTVTIKGLNADDLWGPVTEGQYQAAIFANILTVPDPGNCANFCSQNIPTEENEYSGNNLSRTNIAEAEPFLKEVDSQADVELRKEASRKADAALAKDVASIPIDPLPNILLWKTTITGPIGDNPIQGPFWNMHEWKLALSKK